MVFRKQFSSITVLYLIGEAKNPIDLDYIIIAAGTVQIVERSITPFEM